MLHNHATSIANPETTASNSPSRNLHVVPVGSKPVTAGNQLLDLVMIASRRCSAFFAEAAVLVLVFGILDLCLLKGRIELPWVVGALVVSVGLLAASIAMDFTAQRWIKAHP